MTVSIHITRADSNRYLLSVHGDTMPDALATACTDAKHLAKQHGDLYLRDCLGGLRAEVRLRDGKATIKRT